MAGFLLPSRVTMSKSVLVKASKVKVNAQIQDFNNWKNWYPAFQNEKLTLVNNQPGPGAAITISLTEGGTTRLHLNLMQSKTDTILVVVKSGSPTTVSYQFILKDHSNAQTQLIWNINANLGWYPWEKIKGIFLDKMNGPQYEAALINLKRAAEK